METLRRPSGLEVTDPVSRSKSAVAKARPVSVQAGTRYDLPRDSETSRSSLDLSHIQDEGGYALRTVRTEVDQSLDRANISSDMDYLRAKEEESNRKREKRLSGGTKHAKRGSLSSLSLSGGKTLFAGRFGDAFRRFESSNQDKPRTPSAEESQYQQGLISDTEALESSPSPVDDLSAYEHDILEDVNRDDISPETRRELERRRLSQEEKRVANAAAEYRRRVAEGDGSGQHRSPAIQNRVQNLLGESTKPLAAPKTATGYGRYTETIALQAKPDEDTQYASSGTTPVSRNPGPIYGAGEGAMAPPDRREGASAPAGLASLSTSASTGYSSTGRPASRPAAPPKPKNLRVSGQDASRPSTSDERSPSIQATPTTPGDDWEANFSRRFPSLSGLEMETEIEIPKYPKLRTREV